MSTNYPGALDSFVNPTATDTLDSATVPHAAQHDNINDAMAAVQVTLGVNPQGGSATVVARLTAIENSVSGKVSSVSGTSPISVTAGTTPVVSIDQTALVLDTSQINWSAITAWAANTYYAKGALIEYQGIAYRRAVAGTSSSTFVSTNWQQISPTPASANTASSLVVRDGSGNFSAGTITATLSGNATNVSGTVAVANGGTGKTIIPVASGWVGGQTYAKGDVVYDNLVYYVRLTDGSGGTSPANDSTNWDARTPTATTNGSSQPNNLLATNSNSGIAVTAVGIGSIPVSAPSTGLTVSNGSITVSGVGNGINVSSNGNLTLGASGNAGGSIAITNTTGVQLIKGSSGTSNHTLPTTTGILLNDASTIDITKGGTGSTYGSAIIAHSQLNADITKSVNDTTAESLFRTGTTIGTVQHLSVEADTVYFVEGQVYLGKTASGTTGQVGIALQYTTNGSTTLTEQASNFRTVIAGATTAQVGTTNSTAANTILYSSATTTALQTQHVRFYGFIRTHATTAGKLNLIFGQSVAGTSTAMTVGGGSFMNVYKIGTGNTQMFGNWS
jgi:hypothetical protein